MKRLIVAAAVVLLVGCAAGSATPTSPSATASLAVTQSPAGSLSASPTPAGATASANAGAIDLATGQDLCYLLTAADFTAASVTGAGTMSTNEYETSYFCVWAGKSVATGGIEMDAFIVDEPSDRDEIFASVDTGSTAEDVTAQVAGSERAHVGTTSSDGPQFAEIAVQSGNFIFGIGIPPAGDWHSQLIALANLTLQRAAAVSAGATALPAASPTQ